MSHYALLGAIVCVLSYLIFGLVMYSVMYEVMLN